MNVYDYTKYLLLEDFKENNNEGKIKFFDSEKEIGEVIFNNIPLNSIINFKTSCTLNYNYNYHPIFKIDLGIEYKTIMNLKDKTLKIELSTFFDKGIKYLLNDEIKVNLKINKIKSRYDKILENPNMSIFKKKNLIVAMTNFNINDINIDMNDYDIKDKYCGYFIMTFSIDTPGIIFKNRIDDLENHIKFISKI